MVKTKYDFSGWATRAGVRCSDGRIIIKDAFKGNDGATVPLVWNHNHNSADNVLGHALLENRDEGVYAYCSFNDTEQGKNAKTLVQHGDICALSIYANQLKENGKDVIHGIIREVSLVLAGANPGAFIENILSHSDGEVNEEEACIFNDSEGLDLSHAQEQKEGNKMPEEKKTEENVQEKELTIEDVFNTLTDIQKKAVYAVIGQAIEDANKQSEEDKKEMKQNAFDTTDEKKTEENVIKHSDIVAAIADARKTGSMRESFLQHGITDVGNLFPEAKTVTPTPELISRDMEWVANVMSNVRRSPFSRVKSTAANITADAARANGYVKGKKKVEEVITALKRTTTPQTVYKLQKMDRDDYLDITDFDSVNFIKQEMKVMLNEELARAFLIGDGREASDDNKINPLNIRPILGDDSTYTVSKVLTRADKATDTEFAKDFVELVIKSRKDYKGSGKPTLYTTEDLLTDMLLIKDMNGHYIYKSEAELATVLRVKEIISVPVFDGRVRTSGENDFKLMGILVNLADYSVGADKGGNVSMFDDFDIDYNKYTYLIETRCSAALVKPYSAITFEEKTAKGSV